jgi:hypothetical protein
MKNSWAFSLFFLIAFTQILAFPLQFFFEGKEKFVFFDKAIHLSLVKRNLPAAFFESRHRRWTRKDAEVAWIKEHARPGDFLLYDVSRLSVLARLWHDKKIPVTGRGANLYRHVKKTALLEKANIQKPFWVLTPYAPGASYSQKEMKELLKNYGKVHVYNLPLRFEGWQVNHDYPPPILKGTSSYFIYYVN